MLQGQLVAAHDGTVAALGWFGEMPWSTQTPFFVTPAPSGVPLGGSVWMFASGNDLMMWGRPTLSTGGPPPVGVYTGSPAGPFARTASIDLTTTVAQQPDGCGGVVTLSQVGTALSISGGASPRPLLLGTTLAAFNAHTTAMTSTASGFGVTWVDADGIHLATLHGNESLAPA